MTRDFGRDGMELTRAFVYSDISISPECTIVYVGLRGSLCKSFLASSCTFACGFCCCVVGILVAGSLNDLSRGSAAIFTWPLYFTPCSTTERDTSIFSRYLSATASTAVWVKSDLNRGSRIARSNVDLATTKSYTLHCFCSVTYQFAGSTNRYRDPIQCEEAQEHRESEDALQLAVCLWSVSQ